MALLEVENLRAGYGSVPVLHGVSLSVDEGANAVLLGLNGAGKSTTLMTLAGLLPATSGEIRYDGKPLTGSPGARVRAGIVLVPEGRHVFPALTVKQNLRLGAWTIRRDARRAHRNLLEVYQIFPRLQERADQTAGTLSGGEQQMLAIGRGMMSSPRLLLIDEASLGLSPKLTEQVFAAVQLINERGVTVLMVEQNAGVLAQADTAFVMQQGRVTITGSGSETLADDVVRAAYLGV
ncbi:ABC transporter ATP-binding protein [Glycomyces sp. YM15]|uniref:ABC transporter ATP-binding protein n=1 Tax=Glycomyces sp. YM15 TaxID=2800446 RepID=UPI001F05BAA7|nr:ABC transporter ATP-binding protein [Glycomyces sp. YM15]